MHNEVSFPLYAACGAAYLTAPNIAARHAFSTRLGGVSTGVLESLNLSVRRGDTPENVRENWRRLGAAAGLDLTRAVYARQVHSADVRIAHAADAQPPEMEPRFTCDGFVTNEPGVPLAVFMADCLPALLHDPAAGVIGAVHCGWRGSVWAAVGQWNSYFNALIYIRSESLQPLQIVLRSILVGNQTMSAMSTGAAAVEAKQMADLIKYAIIVVSSAPIMCMYPLVQKYFNQGVMLGSLKG